MIVKTTAGDLASTLAKVTWVVEARSTVPILSNVLLAADGASLQIRGTDLDVQATSAIESGYISRSGSITVNARALSAVLKTVDAADVIDLTGQDEDLRITGENLDVRLSILPAHDFPDMRAPRKASASIAMGIDVFRSIVDRVSYAISYEETRYYLNGVYAETRSNGAFRLIATDGHRMALCSLEEGKETERSGAFNGIIIPKEAIKGVRRAINGKMQGRIELSHLGDAGDGYIAFMFNRTTVLSKLIDGTFPDYERVIRGEMPAGLRVNRARLRQAVERVMSISSRDKRGVGMSFNAESGNIEVSYVDPENGRAYDGLPAAPLTAQHFRTTGFNPNYLLDALAPMTGSMLEIHQGGNGAPDPTFPHKLVDVGSGDVLSVLMPMQVS